MACQGVHLNWRGRGEEVGRKVDQIDPQRLECGEQTRARLGGVMIRIEGWSKNGKEVDNLKPCVAAESSSGKGIVINTRDYSKSEGIPCRV